MNQAQNLQQAPMPVSPQPGLAPQSGRGASVVCFVRYSHLYYFY